MRDAPDNGLEFAQKRAVPVLPNSYDVDVQSEGFEIIRVRCVNRNYNGGEVSLACQTVTITEEAIANYAILLRPER